MITGCSGAGKTAIAAVLADRGLAAIDADDDPLLARDVDAAGNVVEEPAVPDFAWLSRHSWAWNPARLDELIRAAAPATLYVCGGAANELELADRFTQVFLLEIDELTMLARIDARPDNDWGRIGGAGKAPWKPGGGGGQPVAGAFATKAATLANAAGLTR